MEVSYGEKKIIGQVDLGHSRLVLRSDWVLEMICDDDIVYDVAQIREVVEATGKLTGGKKCCHLTLAGKYTSVTKEAREFIATPEAVKFTSAEAYVIQSLAQRIVANFYLKFDKPLVPTKVFTEVERAEAWLKTLQK